MPTPERSVTSTSSDATASPAWKSQRVLACVQCQQRKIKCDRRFPCVNCTKSNHQCVPGAQVAQRRRRRFPERVLLDRLRHYEDVLRQNNIKFEPLHPDATGKKQSAGVQRGNDVDVEQSSPGTTNAEREYEAKNIWHAMSREFRDDPDNTSDSSDDDLREGVVKKAWDQMLDTHEHLLFSSPTTAVDLSTLHPDPVQIFRLWQLYLDNVDPLLKITHTPTLQGRIIEAAGNIFSISPNLEALMFSIYTMAISTLDDSECRSMYAASKDDLLARYQLGCHQALLNANFLRTSDRDCLTALLLYLISTRATALPPSLSSLLGIAVRIAQRMGLHSEAVLAKCTALEAEMRRRLWWALVLLDARIAEMSSFKNAMLDPTWDCKIPLNVNDSDFRLEMKEAPHMHGMSTDALFSVVRCELADVVRHAMFHLTFGNPALKPIAKRGQHEPVPGDSSELAGIEQMIENKYLRFCDPSNPLHFMTLWTTRLHIAKWRLLEYHHLNTDSSAQQTIAQRSTATSYAFSMLEADTKLLSSPLIKKFLWLSMLYFPFPAYMQVLQHLKRDPVSDQAERAWTLLDQQFEARFDLRSLGAREMPFFNMLARIIYQAWEAREAALKRKGELVITPMIVSAIRMVVPPPPPQASSSVAEQTNASSAMDHGDAATSVVPVDFTSYDQFGNIATYDGVEVMEPMPYGGAPSMNQLDIDFNQFDWSTMDWGFGSSSIQ